MATNDGGPALPLIERSVQANGGDGQLVTHYRYSDGMTLRDYFAGQCLAGLASRRVMGADDAAWAYRMADAMVAAREAK
jgi:hypothetical protein